MVGTEICSFHCLKIRTSVITPPSTTEATSVLFQQNHRRGLGQTFSVLLFPEGQWKRLLTAVFLGGAFAAPHIIRTAVYLHGELFAKLPIERSIWFLHQAEPRS